MKQHPLKILLALSFLLATGMISAQKFTISGQVKDARNGETLIGVGVFIRNTTTGVVTNAYGFYSLSLMKGEYPVTVSYIGYETIDTVINLSENKMIHFEMREEIRQLQEVVIKAEQSRENVNSTQMSVVTLSNKTMKQIPVAFGEADILKTIVLLPGVKTTDEGGSTLSVRGGGRDQNLIILDEATVYNASHLGNMLSVFNNDAIQNVEFFKGNMPAQYGGRLSSVIDMRMKDGNRKKFGASGGIGTLSSRLTLEGPIVRDKGSFFISGRRAYIDLLTKAIHSVNDSFPSIPYYFYDLNLKANYSLNTRHRLYLSGYFGKDVFEMNSEDNAFQNRFSWGNYTGTFRWNYIASEKLFTNLTLLVSNYNYLFGNTLTVDDDEGNSKETSFDWDADLVDYSAKYDVDYFINSKHQIKTGFVGTLHDFNPGNVEGRHDTLSYDFRIPANKALEYGIYIADEYHVTSKFTIEMGLRYSLFQNMGKTNVYVLNNEYLTTDTLFYGKGKIYNHYQSFEPRFAVNYKLGEYSSIKAGYSRTSQYIHVASNSNTGSLIDIWVGSGVNIKPQRADLYSMGFFKNAFNHQLETSVEIYYKDMYNQIEFREFATPQFNERMDEDFRFGIARSYGVEMFAKKSAGKLTGWVGYTWSKTEKKTKDLKDQKGWYLSSFDRRHDLTIVAMYDLSKRISVSGSFQLKSGRPFTSPVLRYRYNGDPSDIDGSADDAVVSVFEGRNNDRMPVFHRLDVSATLRNKEKPGRKFHSELTLSIFDVYNRNNPISIYFRPDEDNENITRAYKQNFLGFMPAITWNFSF